jgi:hypothetical protein
MKPVRILTKKRKDNINQEKRRMYKFVEIIIILKSI